MPKNEQIPKNKQGCTVALAKAVFSLLETWGNIIHDPYARMRLDFDMPEYTANRDIFEVSSVKLRRELMRSHFYALMQRDLKAIQTCITQLRCVLECARYAKQQCNIDRILFAKLYDIQRIIVKPDVAQAGDKNIIFMEDGAKTQNIIRNIQKLPYSLYNPYYKVLLGGVSAGMVVMVGIIVVFCITVAIPSWLLFLIFAACAAGLTGLYNALYSEIEQYQQQDFNRIKSNITPLSELRECGLALFEDVNNLTIESTNIVSYDDNNIGIMRNRYKDEAIYNPVRLFMEKHPKYEDNTRVLAERLDHIAANTARLSI